MPTPQFEAFRSTWNRAVDAGLVAAAARYHGALRERLQRGYTSGDFVTGETAASVQMGGIVDTIDGRKITVGTNELVPLYWELGHLNLFTRKYERVEHWRETLETEGAGMRDDFVAAFESVMSGAGRPDVAAPALSTEFDPGARFRIGGGVQ